ncbi:3'-phosphoadenosine 5'-phosphosulfate sulfotransferase (PAPS reductase)/FAD synthetase [Cupriavidus metallidurans]|jgi:3'-phosphoadenosine 5'-phosphosulfate sulfotransferase (PAPS reductase)/FAD synthetase|uniref:phosphoadenosine phosphosulfate reductase domain-containing protein n=1 Tax=Cupriavidus TaxID=106589 RepID=UPI000493ACD2|nr:phosphoadenosine phosphosulfate reductase family protein [Cupriavidus metallidurans]MDE4918177.1 phosphoadenosine phosphosulfate reductase family protein [Cupriavidus metallidurans]
MSIVHVVSMSGGKDSTATAILALEQHGKDACRFVFADTGNEHEATYEYALGYLPSALGIKVDVVRADFTDEFATKRANLGRLAAGEPETAVYGRRQFKYSWTPEAAARALELLHPTGNPYLDMCLVKGGFPSRKRQFCTDYLKTQPLTAYAVELLDAGHAVWSWQGVRIDESHSRRVRLQGTGACVKAFEEVGGGLFNYRPILRWKVQDVFQAHELAGIKPNPLYLQGMDRVGCMPCINCSKGELREIARRFPAEVERIAAWERLVSEVCRPRSPVSFFHLGAKGHAGQSSTIHSVVEWSRTGRGGRQYDLLVMAELESPAQCSSAYGLCE